MCKSLLLLLSFIVISSTAFSQTTTITGTLKDTSLNKSVENAVVALLTPKDSVLISFARAKSDGSFSLKNINQGNYILSVSHPSFGEYVDEIKVDKPDQILSLIALTPKSKLLEAVIVKSGNPIRLKGDTTIYTADSFKVSANANVEELLKKMPGIQVDKNGEIKAMGQTVEKVLVDGEEFFGDDPGMAVKNLRADAVKEVQVFDKKSEQSEFTGIDDGVTQKTINLKLKEDKKKGYFGKIDLAGGTRKEIDDRYNSNLLLSSFKGKRKITGFLLNGNTGQDGLDWRDEEKFGGGDGNLSVDEEGSFSYNGSSNDDEVYINTDNGFNTNTNAGLQYSNKFNDKATVNFSPKFNDQRYNNRVESFVQTQIGDSVLNENSTGNVNVNRNNVKVRGIYDVKIDSFNTLKITANTNFYNTNSKEIREAFTTGKTGTPKNSSTRFTDNTNEKQAISGNIVYSHKFRKLRRTLSLNADWNFLNSTSNNFLKSKNEDFFSGVVQDIDQMKDNEQVNAKVGARLVYTEPINKTLSLELGYQFSVNDGTNNQNTFSYTQATAKYDAIVDSLSNSFKQIITLNTPSARLNFSNKKFKINVGTGISFTEFKLDDRSFNRTYNRNFTNFFPSANLNYTYKSNHSLRINYSGLTRQPTLNQLQPLRNNNDQFNLYIGNPDLRNSFTNSINVSHNAYNFLKDFYMYQSVNFTVETDAITNNRTIDPNSAKSITQPINTNGNLSYSFYGGGGFKIKKIDTRVNFGPNISYRRNVDFINNKESIAKNKSYGANLGLYKTKDKKYEISIGNRYGYNSQTTTQNSNKNNYYTYTLDAEAKVYYKKVWSIETELEYFSRQKTAQVPGLSYKILNAKAQRTFKNNEYSLYFTVRDILNQNIGVDRRFFSNTFSETRNQRLQRYFLVGFRWDFKNRAPKAK